MRTIDPREITDNTFKLIGSDWMLLTAGPPEDHNTMTASWGGFGVLWGKNVCFCVVRPQRHTLKFVERESHFTLAFFPESSRPALDFCGTRSGADTPDKARKAGLTPVAGTVSETTTFAEARLVITCRKVYHQDIDPARFLDPTIDENYPRKDYHRMFFGEIVRVETAE